MCTFLYISFSDGFIWCSSSLYTLAPKSHLRRSIILFFSFTKTKMYLLNANLRQQRKTCVLVVFYFYVVHIICARTVKVLRPIKMFADELQLLKLVQLCGCAAPRPKEIHKLAFTILFLFYHLQRCLHSVFYIFARNCV